MFPTHHISAAAHRRHKLNVQILEGAQRIRGSRGSRCRKELARTDQYDSFRAYYQVALRNHLITTDDFHFLRHHLAGLWNVAD